MSNALTKFFESLPQRIHAELNTALVKEAQALSDAQRQAVESLAEESSGHLAASCVVAPGRDDLEVIVQAGGELTTKEIRKGSGEPFDTAVAFEFGTTRQHAKPFFWPTFHARRDQMTRNLQGALTKALKR